MPQPRSHLTDSSPSHCLTVTTILLPSFICCASPHILQNRKNFRMTSALNNDDAFLPIPDKTLHPATPSAFISCPSQTAASWPAHVSPDNADRMPAIYFTLKLWRQNHIVMLLTRPANQNANHTLTPYCRRLSHPSWLFRYTTFH